MSVLKERDEASLVLDKLVAPDPTKTLAQRIQDAFADFQMVLDHCARIYDHFSRGRISKPNTVPEEVITLAEDFETEDRARLDAQLLAAEKKVIELTEQLATWKQEADKHERHALKLADDIDRLKARAAVAACAGQEIAAGQDNTP